jgi:hypothetical protein
MLSKATEIAAKAHAGQVDKANQPYILHPLRVMFQMTGDYEQITAVLYDVVEDSSITLEDLRSHGFPEPKIADVQGRGPTVRPPTYEQSGSRIVVQQNDGHGDWDQEICPPNDPYSC